MNIAVSLFLIAPFRPIDDNYRISLVAGTSVVGISDRESLNQPVRLRTARRLKGLVAIMRVSCDLNILIISYII